VDLSALRIFICVGRLGSFSKASVALGVAQPTVSRVIGELERHFGGPLFYRTGRGVTLTDMGEVALVRAQALAREAEQLTEDIHSFRCAPSGLVILGVLPSTVTPLVADLHVRLLATFPNIRLRVLEGFSDQIERWLSEGVVDVGLPSHYRRGNRTEDDVLLHANLVLVAGPDAPPLPEQIPFDAAARLPLVLAADPNGLRVLVEDVARRRGVSLNVAVETNSLAAQRDLVRRCGYYTIMAPEAVAADNPSGRLLTSTIVRPVLPRRVVLAVSRQRPLSRASRAVLQTLKAVANQSLQAGELVNRH
jgi:LysR family transcriptional regulator, nitrogen assimilation regulatory protein